MSGQQFHVCSQAESKCQRSVEQWTGVVPLAVRSAASLWENQGIQDVETSAGTLRRRQKRSRRDTVHLLSGFMSKIKTNQVTELSGGPTWKQEVIVWTFRPQNIDTTLNVCYLLHSTGKNIIIATVSQHDSGDAYCGASVVPAGSGSDPC